MILKIKQKRTILWRHNWSRNSQYNDFGFANVDEEREGKTAWAAELIETLRFQVMERLFAW